MLMNFKAKDHPSHYFCYCFLFSKSLQHGFKIFKQTLVNFELEMIYKTFTISRFALLRCLRS